MPLPELDRQNDWPTVEAVSELVSQWLAEAATLPPDPAGQQLADLLGDPAGLAFAVGFVDRVVRPDDNRTAARNMSELARGTPTFLPAHLRAAVRLGGVTAPLAPTPVTTAARAALRRLVGHLVLDSRPDKLGPALARVRAQGMRCNVNLLGEAVLGRREADRRLSGTRALIARDDVDYVSIKVSATTAPHQPFAFEETVNEVVDRLRPLYLEAARTGTFINLDMEEYRDLEMTMAVFQRLLTEPALTGLRAGIVLQAYLPDALGALHRLEAWAGERLAAGGAPIKVRLVKGANLPMETIEAERHGWPLATWGSKVETDANYKRCLDWALRPEHAGHLHVGIAGHNLFDVAWSWLLANRRGVTEAVEYEMLLGMATTQAEVVRRHVGGLLLYTPIVSPAEFDVAIAYLVRRLEEGASPENFMSAVFDLGTDAAAFARERDRFAASLEVLASTPDPVAHRNQDRTAEPTRAPGEPFGNAPDTDPAIPANQRWAAEIRTRPDRGTLGADLVEAGRVATESELDQVMGRLTASDWPSLSPAARADVLDRAGLELEGRRAELMAVAADETGKTLDQSDPEVSEAVDFAHWYAHLARELETVDGAVAEASGVVAVTPPWNFPIAIPAGMIMSALAAGATVAVKPAPESPRTAAVVLEALWAAGVPRDALALLTLDEDALGRQFIGHPTVSRVMLTGSWETAELFRGFRPGLEVLAETSGKNAIIVTPSADLDLAAADVAASAFGHAGQKCSAASLVVLVGPVARSRRFREQLLDAVNSLRVGWPENASSQMGPLVTPPGKKLRRGLTELGEGENWVLQPQQLDDTDRLWSPGIRAHVKPGSEFHRTEYFGPVLGVMSARDLAEAIDIVNGTDFGLTSGLHSLDSAEIEQWLGEIKAGNLYVNRGTTGAIVQRQPFGGWKKSAVGPTAKAGGVNTLVPLVRWRTAEAAADPALVLDQRVRRVVRAHPHPMLERAAASDERAWQAEFGIARDVQGLAGERNIVRYLPWDGPALVRASDPDATLEALRSVIAALRAGVTPALSVSSELPDATEQALNALGVEVRIERRDDFLRRVVNLTGRLRHVGAGGDAVAAAASQELTIYRGELVEAGRVEMLPWLLEQAVSITAHRFGSPDHLTDALL